MNKTESKKQTEIPGDEHFKKISPELEAEIQDAVDNSCFDFSGRVYTDPIAQRVEAERLAEAASNEKK